MYAVIETGGKQYKVEAGQELYIEKLNVEADDKVVFDKVLAVGGDDGIKVGSPYVKGAKVNAKVIKNGKAKKVTDSLTPRFPSPTSKHKERCNPEWHIRKEWVRPETVVTPNRKDLA